MALDVIVVGGGVMGCAAAAATARAGHKVRLFERHRLGSELGSSHGPSRIIRLSYADAAYVPLSGRSYVLWRELAAEAGEPLLVPTGGIDVGTTGTASLERTRSAMIQAGVAFETWNAADIRRHYPQFRFGDQHVALFQSETAILAADRCVAALAHQATSHGATVHEGEAVLLVEPDGEGALVRTSNRTIRADRVILCAGPSMRAFLRDLHLCVPLVVSQEQVSYLAVRSDADYLPGRFPICIRHFDAPIFSSIFPIFGASGIKMMIEQKIAASEQTNRAIDPHNEAQVRADALALIEGVTGEIVRSDSCHYTLTPDQDFLIDKHPAHPQIVICSACSGHGFKFAAAIGEMLLNLVEGGDLPASLRMFATDRAGLLEPSSGDSASTSNCLLRDHQGPVQ